MAGSAPFCSGTCCASDSGQYLYEKDEDPGRIGAEDFDLMRSEAVARAPLGELVDIMDVGFTCAFLATSYARRLTGSTIYVDGGVNIMA